MTSQITKALLFPALVLIGLAFYLSFFAFQVIDLFHKTKSINFGFVLLFIGAFLIICWVTALFIKRVFKESNWFFCLIRFWIWIVSYDTYFTFIGFKCVYCLARVYACAVVKVSWRKREFGVFYPFGVSSPAVRKAGRSWSKPHTQIFFVIRLLIWRCQGISFKHLYKQPRNPFYPSFLFWTIYKTKLNTLALNNYNS